MDCLVLNDTQVLPARLVGQRALTGGRWQGLFLSADENGFWQLLGKTRGKVATGEKILLLDDQMHEDVSLTLLKRLDEGGWLALPDSDELAVEILTRIGRVPLPHYIRDGQMRQGDQERYQTVYAKHPGAVAAPTAGLHFTNELLRKLGDRRIATAYVTLHVGLDTFRPIKATTLADHRMHSEWGTIEPEAVDTIRERRANGGRIIAVGTTSVRVLESASAEGNLEPWTGTTDLFIRPPYQFRAVDALLTNFHLPRTTLLVLVRTFGGDKLIEQAYREAIEQQYRFYSYGDAMLIM
ncbi:MAG: tRNA preQ1(34) S-adenosylmethionine ribosyltransferase-isomerase QueA [Planctomycetia bacterium]|nr:tRNA preQ1(34) S-adenosylmethionine ribosyltransferase-isomerase QueA [Planctomycetia bacterium]